MNHILQITLIGNHCNDWPSFFVSCNCITIFDCTIRNTVLNIPLQSNSNQVILEHRHKSFGKDHKWDTKSKDGKIVSDRYVTIGSISLNEINIMPALHKLKFEQSAVEGEPTIGIIPFNGTFNFNGKVILDINPSPMIWLTNLLHKQDLKEVSYFSDYSKLFHYERDKELIAEIERMLDV